MAINPFTIELQGLVKNFPSQPRPALDNLTGILHNGAVIGLVGPDGAGKTTLLRLLAGLLRPDGGEIRVCGLEPLKDSNLLRRLLSYMPQKFGLYEDLTVQENLNLYAELRNVDHSHRQQLFSRLLQFTSLEKFTRRLAGKLSGGMKQKLGLACTLVGQPQILLLDEPGVGVDPISRRDLWSMVDKLASEGMLILWSTSYLDEAEQCRQVWLLNHGKLLYQGAPDTLSQQLAGRCWLVSSGNNNRQLLQQLIQHPAISDATIQGSSVRLILNRNAPAGEPRQACGIKELTCRPIMPRFEDAFIDLLGGSIKPNTATADIFQQMNGHPDDILIEAQNLTKKFGDFTATDRVNFTVQRGEIFGLLGPNGAGKSTTFKMMCGLLTPSSGKALVTGMSLNNRSGETRRRIGYMAQKFSLYGNLTVEQNLRFFSGIYGLRGKQQCQQMDNMIHAFSLHAILNQPADAQPPGFRQRLALACALMHQPEILFLDEPTSGVDPLTRREFWLHINHMVEKGTTVMVTTHFMDEAEYCDRIGLIYHGQLIACGTPDALKHSTLTADTVTAITIKNPLWPQAISNDPTMEQAFIHLIQQWDKEYPQ